jgi:23S rRNA G2445 N2-methylase RlmL
VVSIDLGGGSLSQRGWRRDAGDAPLREHLAAVLLMLCRFDPRSDALVDPMCGSGTIPIEAILAARATPRPGSALPALAVLGLARPAEPLFPDAAPLVIGCDLDLGVLAAARDNARAAGVADLVIWQRADVTRLEPAVIADIARERGVAAPATGLLLTNPPYGERLDDAGLDELYAAIAATCRRFRGWRAGFLVGSPGLERAFLPALGRPRIKKPLANANLRAYFYLYDL